MSGGESDKKNKSSNRKRKTSFILFLGFTDALSKACLFSAERCRVFRPDKSYAVTQGKWYFEFEILTAGNLKVGWARPGCTADKELGSDDQAYVFDGSEVRYSNLVPQMCLYAFICPQFLNISCFTHFASITTSSSKKRIL